MFIMQSKNGVFIRKYGVMDVWNIEKMDEYLRTNLKKSRYEHSVSVMNTSIKLAKQYNENIFKAKIAGLVHDCAKNLSDEEILSILTKHGCIIDDVCRSYPQIMHGAAGSIIANEIMDIDDEDILSAVKYHTTGKKDMSTLEKIIYIADYIEPLRNFEGVEEIRKEAEISLNNALIKSFDMTIKYVIESGKPLHTDTVEGRNYLIITDCR